MHDNMKFMKQKLPQALEALAVAFFRTIIRYGRHPDMEQNLIKKIYMNYPEDRIEEEFNEIPGFEGHYSITWDGEVWSHWGSGKWMPVKMRGKYKYVVLGNHRGYPEVHYIHNLMYTIFLGAVPENAKVIHKDGNTLNNSIDNLDLKFQKKRVVEPEVIEKKEDKEIEDLTCERKACWEEVFEKYGVDFEWDKDEELRKTREFYYNGMDLFIPS